MPDGIGVAIFAVGSALFSIGFFLGWAARDADVQDAANRATHNTEVAYRRGYADRYIRSLEDNKE